MKATLEQAAQLLKYVSDKTIQSDRLQRAYDSGIISDVLDADLSRVERDAVREVLNLPRLNPRPGTPPKLHVSEAFPVPVEVNGGLDIRKVLANAKSAGRLAFVNSNVTNDWFGPTRTGTHVVLARIAKFGCDIREFDRRRELYANGLVDLGASELAAANDRYPSGSPLEEAIPLAACERFWLDGGRWSFPYLSRSGDGQRKVSLFWTDGLRGVWLGLWSFLVASVEEYLSS